MAFGQAARQGQSCIMVHHGATNALSTDKVSQSPSEAPSRLLDFPEAAEACESTMVATVLRMEPQV